MIKISKKDFFNIKTLKSFYSRKIRNFLRKKKTFDRHKKVPLKTLTSWCNIRFHCTTFFHNPILFFLQAFLNSLSTARSSSCRRLLKLKVIISHSFRSSPPCGGGLRCDGTIIEPRKGKPQVVIGG